MGQLQASRQAGQAQFALEINCPYESLTGTINWPTSSLIMIGLGSLLVAQT